MSTQPNPRTIHVEQPMRWHGRHLEIVDQTRLPQDAPHIRLETAEAVWTAIQRLQVRGAPAIGCCAAFGVLVGLRQRAPHTVAEAVTVVRETADYLATSRPTAVNLFWALARMRRRADETADAADAEDFFARLEAEAVAIFDENVRLCAAIADHGAPLIREGCGVLTHCNAGPMAACGYGTALAPMLRAHELGRRFRVYADETRPLLQGARITAWELEQAGIDVTLICDSTAGRVMREGRVDLVIVGADRIASNGDTANKIGTYGVAVLARHHGIPFYVAAPSSTLDLELSSGESIPIEERASEEITHVGGHRIAPAEVGVYSPAFDVTPANLVTAFITEKGIVKPPFA